MQSEEEPRSRKRHKSRIHSHWGLVKCMAHHFPFMPNSCCILLSREKEMKIHFTMKLLCKFGLTLRSIYWHGFRTKRAHEHTHTHTHSPHIHSSVRPSYRLNRTYVLEYVHLHIYTSYSNLYRAAAVLCRMPSEGNRERVCILNAANTYSITRAHQIIWYYCSTRALLHIWPSFTLTSVYAVCRVRPPKLTPQSRRIGRCMYMHALNVHPPNHRSHPILIVCVCVFLSLFHTHTHSSRNT